MESRYFATPPPCPPPLTSLPDSDELFLRATPSGRKFLSAYERRLGPPTVIDSPSDEVWSRVDAEMTSIGSNPSSEYDRYFWQKIHNPNRVLKLCRYFSSIKEADAAQEMDALYKAKSMPSLVESGKWMPSKEWGLNNKRETVQQLKQKYESKPDAGRAKSCASLHSGRSKEKSERSDGEKGRHSTTIHLTVGGSRVTRSDNWVPSSRSHRQSKSVSSGRATSSDRANSPSTSVRSRAWTDSTDIAASTFRRGGRRGPLSESEIPDLVHSPEWMLRAAEMKARRDEKERKRLEAFDAQLRGLRSMNVIDSIQTEPQKRSEPRPTGPVIALISTDPRRFHHEVERRPIADDFDKNRNYFETVSREADFELAEKQLERMQSETATSAPSIPSALEVIPSPPLPPPVHHFAPYSQSKVDGSPIRRPDVHRTHNNAHYQSDPSLLNPYGEERPQSRVTPFSASSNRNYSNETPTTGLGFVDNVYKYVRSTPASSEPLPRHDESLRSQDPYRWTVGEHVFENGYTTSYRPPHQTKTATPQRFAAPPGFLWDAKYGVWRRHDNGVILDVPKVPVINSREQNSAIYSGWV